MDWLIYIGLFFLGGPVLVESVGYLWHRWVEHREVLGKGIAFRHYKHHEVQYPVTKLRTQKYHNANSWSWYVVGGVASGVAFLVAPWVYALSFVLGAWAYAWGVVMHMHTAFHTSGHFLWKYKWFQKLVKLHDIHHYDNSNYGICFFGFDRLFGTYNENFPHDDKGKRIKKNVFKSYKLHRTHSGTASN